MLLCWCCATLQAQGVTGAALQGRILSADSSAIEEATVLVTNAANGQRWQTTSHAKGRYSLEQLSIGGPYVVEVHALGYAPGRRDGLVLGLGQRFTADFALQPVAYELSGITVIAETDPLINAGRTAPSYSVPESTATRVPVFNRDFLRLALLSPRVTRTPSGGLSIAGQPDRLNAVQVDGATNQDLLGSSTLAGIQVLGARTLSVESIQELQVISAPFDVRYGNFAAGLINVVTKSGTNRWEGAVTGFYADRGLVGKDAAGGRGGEFTNGELTLTLGGPLVRDRAAFFLDASLQRQVFPESAALLGVNADSEVGVRTQDALRFRDILGNTYGVDAGEIGAYPFRVPAANVLGKISLQLGVNSRLEISHAYSEANLSISLDRGFPAYALTSRVFALPVRSHATRAAWNASFGGRYSNELTLARQQEGFHCDPASDFPVVDVRTSGRSLTAGSSCPPGVNRTDDNQNQNLLELTDNFTVLAGSHRLTIGTHDERLHILALPPLDYFFITSWEFGSLDDLEAGRAEQYQATLRDPARSSGPLSDFVVTQVGGYLQDQWNPIPRLTLTGGIRMEVPYTSREPSRNDTLFNSPLGIDNTRTPSGHPLWSPRLGVNYDLSGKGTTYLRGGFGWFAGRPAYKWFVAVDAHSGLEEYSLLCTGPDVPAFTLDPTRQPTSCGARDPQFGPINVFNPAFRFPRNFKVALGADHRLPGGVVGTLDFLYTQAVDQYDLMDLNLRPPATVAAGEDDRLMYGAVEQGTGLGMPTRVDDRFRQVIEVRNAGGDRAYSLTAQLQRRLANGTEFGASYTYSQSRDRLSSNADNTDGDVDITAVDGSLEHRQLATALWNVPHRITFLATANLPFHFRGALSYEGLSGTPFTYTIGGDANADGFGDDDIMYVPAHPVPGGDVELAVFDESTGRFLPAPSAEYSALAKAIWDQPCLRTQRGRIMRRNSCRTPWSNHADARLSRMFSTFQGHNLEFMLDVFNVLHLIDSDWGEVRGADGNLLELVGYDQARGRGVYHRIDAAREFVDQDASRWRMQLGARYSF
jgi:outer membrane receptor protein involved in Fe transport